MPTWQASGEMVFLNAGVSIMPDAVTAPGETSETSESPSLLFREDVIPACRSS